MVIAIIGILASVILTSLSSARSKARDTKRVAQLREVQKALEMYYTDNGVYPVRDSQGGCSAAVWNTPLAPLVSGGYISGIPRDPIDSQVDSNLCYNYMSDISTSTYRCNGIARHLYMYAIMFSLENPDPKYGFMVASNTPAPGFGYCITGALK